MKQRIISAINWSSFHDAVDEAMRNGWSVKYIMCNETSYHAILEHT